MTAAAAGRVRRGRPAEYRVAVPSFQRADGFARKTLTALLAGHVAPSRIVVFLHDNDPQLPEYLALIQRHGLGHVVTDRRGITAQRTAIIEHFPAGTPLVCIDDDVTEVVEAIDAKTTRPIANLDGLFRSMFTDTAARDLWVWGLAPVVNPFYLTPGRLADGLKFLIFSLYGCFTRPGHPVHTFTVPYKDEHELSLRAWWYDGAVLRHDGAAARANFYTDPGGCQAPAATRRTPELVAESVASLEAQWPGLIRRNTRKKDTGFVEITLSPRRRHAGRPADCPVPGDLPRKRGA